MALIGLGGVVFGVTIGWIAYRLLRQRTGTPWIAQLIAVVAIIAGVGTLALFRDEALFGWYAIGLALGVFATFALGVRLNGRQEVQSWWG